MSKDRMKEAADRQVGETARELSEEHREKRESRKSQRTERLVIRLSKDELRRISAYYDSIHIPISTGVRSLVLEHIRRV